uniref:Ferredoxin-thioredoxin reductase catalytic chain, chloroplastic n=1 Tax=Rhizophora mucronata TaxID=61149 RepID=A0A2P2JXN1_RHIMU
MCGVSVEPSEKSVEIMRKFSEQYARKSGTYFCADKGVTAVVIKVTSLFPILLIYKIMIASFSVNECIL